jgi:hypothetical protein
MGHGDDDTEIYEGEEDSKLAKKEEKEVADLKKKVKDEENFTQNLEKDLRASIQKEKEMLEIKEKCLELVSRLKEIEKEEEGDIGDLTELIPKLHDKAMDNELRHGASDYTDKERKLIFRILQDADELKEMAGSSIEMEKKLLEMLKELRKKYKDEHDLFDTIENIEEEMEQESEAEREEVINLIEDIKRNTEIQMNP